MDFGIENLPVVYAEPKPRVKLNNCSTLAPTPPTRQVKLKSPVRGELWVAPDASRGF